MWKRKCAHEQTQTNRNVDVITNTNTCHCFLQTDRFIQGQKMWPAASMMRIKNNRGPLTQSTQCVCVRERGIICPLADSQVHSSRLPLTSSTLWYLSFSLSHSVTLLLFWCYLWLNPFHIEMDFNVLLLFSCMERTKTDLWMLANAVFNHLKTLLTVSETCFVSQDVTTVHPYIKL